MYQICMRRLGLQIGHSERALAHCQLFSQSFAMVSTTGHAQQQRQQQLANQKPAAAAAAATVRNASNGVRSRNVAASETSAASSVVQNAIPAVASLGAEEIVQQQQQSATGNGERKPRGQKRGRSPNHTLDQQQAEQGHEEEAAGLEGAAPVSNARGTKPKQTKHRNRNQGARPIDSLQKGIAGMNVEPEGAHYGGVHGGSHKETGQESHQQSEINARTEPLLSTDFTLESGSSVVTLELIRNNKNEMFLIIRSKDVQTERSKRIALPFSMAEQLIDHIDSSIKLLQSNGEDHVAQNIRENGASYANMYQFISGFSSYYVDFVLNGEQVGFKISEKKRVLKSKIRRSFELLFVLGDMACLYEQLYNFYHTCLSYMKSDNYTELPLKIFRSDNFSFEWITRNDMNMLLKVYNTNERIFYPMNVCRAAQASLKRISDYYDQYGKDVEAYNQLMREERDDLNHRRISKGLDALPEFNAVDRSSTSNLRTSHSPQAEGESANDLPQESSSSPPLPRYQQLYSTRVNSMENGRSYLFDLVIISETDEVKIRLVEVIRSRAGDNFPGKKSLQKGKSGGIFKRHTLLIPISQKNNFIDTLDQMVDSIPLPPEEAFFFHRMRCFVKFTIRRGRGLTLKIKTQQVLNANEQSKAEDSNPDQPIGAAESGDNPQENGPVHGASRGPQKFGNTEIIELPVQLVHKIYKYLSANCQF